MCSVEVPPKHRLEQVRREQGAPRRGTRQRATEGDARRAGEELITTIYQEQFEKGYRESLLRCVALCEVTDAAIPTWARRALARAFSEWRDAQRKGKKRPLDLCILGERTGRHANIVTAEREHRRRQVIFEAVETAKHLGLEGGKVFDVASKLLVEYRNKYGGYVYSKPETVKSIYHDFKKKGAERNRAISSELALLTPNLCEFALPRTKKGR